MSKEIKIVKHNENVYVYSTEKDKNRVVGTRYKISKHLSERFIARGLATLNKPATSAPPTPK